MPTMLSFVLELIRTLLMPFVTITMNIIILLLLVAAVDRQWAVCLICRWHLFVIILSGIHLPLFHPVNIVIVSKCAEAL